ncbi:MAG TPA: DUF3626 domain-containing protein [Micromonosporaceae bacterium]
MVAWERALAHVSALTTGEPGDPSWRVTLQFHPDRLTPTPAGPVPILAEMARTGVYRSQFETGTSNGGLTAHEGGDRWRWESRMFAGVYDREPAAARPKYGALNFRGRLIGGSPRFGSAYLRLDPRVLSRTTFCYPDSVFEPERFAVASSLSTVVACARARDHDPRTWDPLDDYVEAHVHGVVQLDRDVEALVLDPCYRGTEVETLSGRLDCAVQWHGGFILDTTTLRQHPDYRGAELVALGVALARDDRLDPRIIGDAARTGAYNLQSLKRVWHYIARFGSPEMPRP